MGLANVQGIGWRGIAEQVKGLPEGPGCRRVFTSASSPYASAMARRKRSAARPSPCLPSSAGRREDLGRHRAGRQGQIRPGELRPGRQRAADRAASAVADGSAIRFRRNRHGAGELASGVYQVRDTLDLIDAAIGVSNGGWKEKDSGHAVAQQVDTALAYRYGATRAAWRGR